MMLTTSRHPRVLVAATHWATCAGLLALLTITCFADTAPESAFLAHVQSVSQWPCYTPITNCDQIVRSTSADGELEFLLFFMRGAYSWPGETLCIRSLRSEITWPDTWQFVDFETCGDADGGLDLNGDTHALYLTWDYPYPISAEPGGVIPVARLVMNVAGPGWLDLVGWHGDVELQHDCHGTIFVTYSIQVDAEAGIECGHVSPHCGYRESGCIAIFEVPELLLNASPGAAADGTVDFWAEGMGDPDIYCPQDVSSHAAWCTAWIDSEYVPGEAHLHVTADAAGLEPGFYETEIELSNTYWGVARCLPVRFTIEDASASVDQNPPATPVTWGWIKTLYR
ncbi:MAG: hypothetical protein KJ970_13735 [Candidatus Eisenbacteria bacterium]|uniref:Uncharacterized protein n=1 Tax=Eiseniibacteriota bacterium TaxID=2212470 RepID=A0A948W7T1_UNCEI|nr:hypothetical protein [Candidatus Eisenbacteria bacterium]MBU1950724.1 hypothetical protein [Candidatus Eisenbacteria bacterium]MBU2691976.1 hypothetical protein [Candidatus Eisenbacteria bacterium]